MPRTPETGTAAHHLVPIRLTPDLVTWIDQHRGPLGRSKFIRNLIREVAHAQTPTNRSSAGARTPDRPPDNQHRPDPPTPTPAGQPEHHRHKPGPEGTRRIPHKGRTIIEYTCACGQVIQR